MISIEEVAGAGSYRGPPAAVGPSVAGASSPFRPGCYAAPGLAAVRASDPVLATAIHERPRYKPLALSPLLDTHDRPATAGSGRGSIGP